MGLHRLQPAGFDGRFAHKKIVKIGDLASAGAGGAVDFAAS
jgi:hypothetical protein